MSLVDGRILQSDALCQTPILIEESAAFGASQIRNADITGAAIAMAGYPNVTPFVIGVGVMRARLTLQDVNGGLRLLAYGLNRDEAHELFEVTQRDHLMSERFTMSYGPCVIQNHLAHQAEIIFGNQDYQPWHTLKNRCINVITSYESKFEVTPSGLYDRRECSYDMDTTFEYQMIKEILKQLNTIKPYISGHTRALHAVAVYLNNV